MYMLVILAVLKDPDRFPSLSFPKNPCLIVICPTIPLQLEMVSKRAGHFCCRVAVLTNFQGFQDV
jgi:hypothetical protein